MEVDINKISTKVWIALVVIWVTLISSGILFIFIFKAELFVSLDLGKIILLGSSITTPVWLFNCAAVILSFDSVLGDGKFNYVNYPKLAVVTAGCTFPIIYTPIISAYLFHTSLQYSVTGILVLEFLFASSVIISGIIERKAMKKNKNRSVP